VEWENEPLKSLYSFKVTNSYSRDQLNYENGSAKNIHYGDIHTKFSTLFNIENEIVPFVNPSESLERIKSECYCVEGDMIFADASEDLDDVGKSIEIVNLNNEKLLSGLHTLLARQKDKKLIVGFGGYLFKSNRIRLQIKKESQGAKVLGISAGRLSNIDIAFPLDKKEQQKIADCLSSIDELVTAQTQKIEALKAHKKGLMQQLFPAEGETVPQLRFPEFRDAGNWEVKKIGQVLIVDARPIKMNDEQDYSLVTVKRRYGGVVSRGTFKGGSIKVKSQFLLEDNDFLISKRQIVHCACGLVPAEFEGSIVSNEYSVLRARKNNDIVFFNYFAQQPKVSQSFLECSIGIVIEKMLFKLNDWLKQEFLFPSFEEQQKIAACLSVFHRRPNHHPNPKTRRPQSPQKRPDAAAVPRR
jgi:type I restriction enzyme S subunit